MVDGKPKQKRLTLGYYPSNREAMLALAEYNKSPYDLNVKTITFGDIYKKWFPEHEKKYPTAAQGLSAAYKKCESIHNILMTDVRKIHMQEIMNANSKLSISSQTNIKTIFKNTFKYALENDIVEKDYSAFVEFTATTKKAEEKTPFTKEELQTIFDNKDLITTFPLGRKRYTEIQLMDTVIVMLYTGVRIGELLNIKSEHVHIKSKYIDLQGTKTPNAKRFVPIHEKIIPILEEWLSHGNEFLFSNTDGNPIKYDTYKKHFFDPTMEILKMDHTPHATRHTFISAMDETNVKGVTLKRIVGHSNKDVTEHYTHKDIEQLIKAINKLSY